MDALRVAAPLARLLLGLSESGSEGEVTIVQRSRRARLWIARGRVIALSGVDVRPLGDTLLALGVLDVRSQRSLLAQDDGAPVGARLVAAGATSSGSVLRALELQLTGGLESLLRWPAGKLEWHPGAEPRASTSSSRAEPHASTSSSRAEPHASSSRSRAEPRASTMATIDLTSAVWSSLLALTEGLSEAAIDQLSGEDALVLTGAGSRRVRGLLHAAESGALSLSQARLALLAAGANSADRADRCGPIDVASVARALEARPTSAQRQLRALLRVLGATLDRPAPASSYALLLRKTREVARNESANVLLDLPQRASTADARKALRRLAHKLHPDRFHAGDERLHALSHRVMGALARAEHALRD